MLKKFQYLFSGQKAEDVKVSAAVPTPAPVVAMWPKGAATVFIYLSSQLGEFKPGKYTLVRQAFVSAKIPSNKRGILKTQDTEPKYSVLGFDHSWSESAFEEYVRLGVIKVIRSEMPKETKFVSVPVATSENGVPKFEKAESTYPAYVYPVPVKDTKVNE